jgi:acetate kinase
MPAKAYTYALPYEYYEKYGVRRYGFHGTSHRFVSERMAEILGRKKEEFKLITCHLGNGCSIAAVDCGKCVDTSMGFTPLDGFMMGTRSGALDPSAVTYIADKENMSIDDINSMLNKKSGMLGVSGVSNDNRDIKTAADNGNERAQLAIDMQRYQILKTIGSYVAAMNGVDAILFTGGIGENDPELRSYICNNLAYLGVVLDEEANNTRGKEIEITAKGSKTRVFVVPTNEELAIARDTVKIVQQ